jgi:polar amino acid transport system substrate-binding protein
MRTGRLMAMVALTTVIAVACTGTGTPSPTGDAGPGEGGVLARAKESGVLTVGMSSGAPIGFLDENGEPQGLMIDICRRMAEREGIETVEPFLMPFGSIIPSLTSNRIDLGCDSFFPTDARKEVVDFSDVVFYNSETLVVTRGNPLGIASLDDLKDVSAGSFEGTVWIDWLNELNDDGANIEVMSYPSPTELLADVASGRLGAAIVDGIVASYAIEQNPDLNIEIVQTYQPRDKESNAVAMPMRKDSNDVRDAINATLEEMRADGTLAELFEKYGLTPPSFYLDLP